MPIRNASNPRTILVDSQAQTPATTPSVFRQPVVPWIMPCNPVLTIAGRRIPRDVITLTRPSPRPA